MLKFHPDKCKTMRIGRSKVEKHEYTLKADLKPMEETISEKDVGVTIDNKLSFCIFSIMSMCFFKIWAPNWVRIFEMKSY
jgi:hypothetical protein